MLRGQAGTQSPDTYGSFCFLLLLLSEVGGGKKYQDNLDFCYLTLSIGQIMWETDHSRLDFLAVPYLRFQKPRKSVGVMLKHPIMIDK